MSNIFLTRLIIQTQSPLCISSGFRQAGYDNDLARDANGLPYIPGTSIAGVWRALATNLPDVTEAFWFGITERSSRLVISNGVLLDSNNKPVIGLVPQQQIEADPLLQLLQQARPHHRDRVRINDRGTAADEAKFDQLMLPKGVRFCVDIQWHDAPMVDPDNSDNLLPIDDYLPQWSALLQCWHQRLFALGGTTRNGLGQIKLIASEQQTLNLHANPAAASVLRRFAIQKQIPTQLDVPAAQNTEPFASLPLKALDNWRCGRGIELLGAASTQTTAKHSIGIISYSEKSINWINNRATITAKPTPVLCGSSIKGILAHRVSYHWRRRTGEWAEQTTADFDWAARPQALAELFGLVDPNDNITKDKNSRAGRLYVDDCTIESPRTVVRQHNQIDRFTGGVLTGALYSEELLYQPEFTVKLWLAPETELAPTLKEALLDTLKDLADGLLPMGAGSGRGTSLVIPQSNAEWLINPEQIQDKPIEQPENP